MSNGSPWAGGSQDNNLLLSIPFSCDLLMRKVRHVRKLVRFEVVQQKACPFHEKYGGRCGVRFQSSVWAISTRPQVGDITSSKDGALESGDSFEL